MLFAHLSYADDKLEHFTVSYTTAYTCSIVSKEATLCPLAILGVGVIKELVLDKTFSKGDVAADSLGVGLSVLMYQF